MKTIFSPAKVNLTLHVTGQRSDGYHLLDSLVCFPDIGDQLTFVPSEVMSLQITGTSDLPADQNNLVLRAADMFLSDAPHEITLEKALPLSSGIGGGSSNGAAVIRYALALHKKNPTDLVRRATNLGADIPVCIASTPQRFQGIGDRVEPIHVWPEEGHILLVNPRVTVSTPAIFKSLERKDNAPMPKTIPDMGKLDDLIDFIAHQRNDLQTAAIAHQPIITDVLNSIGQTNNCLIARMSGSGATCFGIFRNREDVMKAAAQIGSHNPEWWVDYGRLQGH